MHSACWAGIAGPEPCLHPRDHCGRGDHVVHIDTPLLRAPPFPGVDASVTQVGVPARSADPSAAAVDALVATIRAARVGGPIWAPPSGGAGVIVRDRPIGAPETDPWAALDHATLLVAHGEDEWVALAAIAGVPVRLLSPGRFGAPGDDAARLRRIAADDVARARYRDPFTGEDCSVERTIALLADWRQTLAGNRGIVAACGFSWWKRREIARFLWSPDHPLRFFRSEARALDHAARARGAVAVWPSRISPAMIAAAAARNIPLVHVEDGFVRSVGLGSNFVPPSSVAVDWCGIHYDPGHPSDLEALLAEGDFPPTLLARAARLRDTILAAGISKYGRDAPAAPVPRADGRRRVLVPGQVEDDMSVRLGGGGLASNLELLRRVRTLEPEAEIWFRPHPDVDAGHRKGAVRDADALAHVDRIVRGGGMATMLDQVDAVHVLTSLTGFEALLRGRDVTCHGMPFYAGWGLTCDLMPVPARRGRPLSLEALIAGVLIVYPRYLDPVTTLPCSPEMLIGRMSDADAHARPGWIIRLRQLQGRLLKRAR
jgi:capsular polysaccharide export protein